MAEIRVKSSAVRALLKSPAVRADLVRRAQLIAARAGDGFEVRSSEPRRRARAAVVATTAEAMRGEAKDGRLSRAMGVAWDAAATRTLVKYTSRAGRVSYITQKQADNYRRRGV